ncbi:MAG: hypothetical protein RMJ43_16510 [Chloroherpetonaceae bacterium]|nr:hypothetical protein [Chthonomonadaceae bacterium]MDW8209432.1 hypothetical protein [Chloroherpetonaceae bacterium]
MDYPELRARALLEPMSRDMLEQQIRRSGGNSELYLRLARACVRDDRFQEALRHYDQAELLGAPEAALERAVLARHIGDFPDGDLSLA